MNLKSITSNGKFHLNYLSNEKKDYKRVYLLLHGYSQKAQFVFDQFKKIIPDDSLIIAPNGPYPLIKHFPLEQKTSEELIAGYAWYFYNEAKDEYLVEPSSTAFLIQSFLNDLKLKNTPITVIGYSQGGYFSIFLPEYIKEIDHIIGINCSFRFDKISKPISLRIDALHGQDDPVVDPKLSRERYNEIIKMGAQGKFYEIENQNHRLSEVFLSQVKKLI